MEMKTWDFSSKSILNHKIKIKIYRFCAYFKQDIFLHKIKKQKHANTAEKVTKFGKIFLQMWTELSHEKRKLFWAESQDVSGS